MPDQNLLKRLVGVGYFPKELPPPFSSRPLAEQTKIISEQWPANGRNAPRTRGDTFSIPRHGRSRRKISIPNPISQFYLSQCIAENWAIISTHIEKSEITLFNPNIPEDSQRTFDPINFEDIESRKNTILSRCGLGLSLDISRFYPTIYTHSIAWALHGKEWCKQNINAQLKNSVGQIIDDLVRKCQDGQSIGIPIGPDTSIVLSEIIGASIDRELVAELRIDDETAFRYTDDFFIGLRDGRTAERTTATVASALSNFELEISSEKTRSLAAASRADPDWSLEISQFRLPADTGRQKRAIEYYFKKAFHLAQIHPGQNVLSYCASRSSTFLIAEETWPIYEEFLLQCARANSTTIELATKILIDGDRRGMQLNKQWIARFAADLIAANSPLDHHWEICWLLFLLRELKLGLPAELVTACGDTDSSAVKLMLLDLGNRELAQVGGLKHAIERHLSGDSLRSHEWLVVYEGARRGWLGNKSQEAVAGDQYFGVLREKNVSFYFPGRTTVRITKEKLSASGATFDPTYIRF